MRRHSHLLAVLLCTQVLGAHPAQSQIPQKPFTNADACIASTGTSRTRAWKGGEPERRDFLGASATKDAKERIQRLQEFLLSYPDSDYAGIAAVLRLGAEGEVGNWNDLAIDSRKLLHSPGIDNPALLVAGYSYLADARFHMKEEEEALIFAKISEVDWAVRCGREAVQQLKTSLSSQEAQSVASSAEFTFAVTEAQVRLLDNDTAAALRESSTALRLKPTDPRPNCLYALALLRGQSPDYQEGIFYLARASSLGVGDEGLKKSVEGMYKAYHGSGKGIDKLWQVAGANASPPADFHIEPEHPKNHTAAKIAVGVAIAALLGYAIVKSPDAFSNLSQAGSVQTRSASYKMMIFGGENHRTYLGCLSCSPGDDESVYTLGGPHGGRAASDSIWNKATFGSPASQYSACSLYADDPPVIVEEDGTYLGRLTLNRYHAQIGIGAKYYDWLHDSVCN